MTLEREIYVILHEEVEGPFTMDELRCEIDAGRVTADLLCAVSGSVVWRPIAELLGRAREHSASLK